MVLQISDGPPGLSPIARWLKTKNWSLVQINGKVLAKVTVAADATPEQVQAKRNPQIPGIAKYLAEGTIRKVVYVPGKLLNIGGWLSNETTCLCGVMVLVSLLLTGCEFSYAR